MKSRAGVGDAAASETKVARVGGDWRRRKQVRIERNAAALEAEAATNTTIAVCIVVAASAEPAKRLVFRLSSLASRGLRSPLSSRRGYPTSLSVCGSQRVRRHHQRDGQGAGHHRQAARPVGQRDLVPVY